jgi:glycosyltransferase involved in cell wall biosynthesis
MTMATPSPLITVIVPFRNAQRYLERCLTCIRSSRYGAVELIGVDDASSDRSAEIARRFCDRVLALTENRGPAFARNRAAEQSSGAILFFIDADVFCFPETLQAVAAAFDAHPSVAAVIGSYDDDPPEQNFVSRYKNLTHHFVHQAASPEASTFWTGCGAIRRETFLGLGGFDESYRRPSIEDIELGYRLRAAGHAIRLDRTLTVRHAKRWTFRSLLESDIRDRALPWTKLQLSSGGILNDLNLTYEQRFSAVLVVLALVGVLVAWWLPAALVLSLAALSVVSWWNRCLYGFYYRRGGVGFCVGSALMHWLYYLYSVAAFASVWVMFKLAARNPPPSEPARP